VERDEVFAKKAGGTIRVVDYQTQLTEGGGGFLKDRAFVGLRGAKGGKRSGRNGLAEGKSK